MAVIMITPPFDICQTELDIKVKPTYARLEAMKSKNAGIIIRCRGIGGLVYKTKEALPY